MANFAYFPHTDEDIRQMLERIGVSSLDDLYSDVPETVKHNGDYDRPDAVSEDEVREYVEKLDKKDEKLKVFVGQGAYDHYAPSVVPYITAGS